MTLTSQVEISGSVPVYNNCGSFACKTKNRCASHQ